MGHEATILPGGVDTNTFRPAGKDGPPREPDPTIFFPAALDEPRKNLALLLAAFGIVLATRPRTRLWIVGAGGDAALAAAPAAVRDATTRLTPGADVPLERYRRAWVTALPAEAEALGLVVLESLACGTPATVLAGGAPAEIVVAGTGTTTAPDEQGLATALLEALEARPCPGRSRPAGRARCGGTGTPRSCRVRSRSTHDDRDRGGAHARPARRGPRVPCRRGGAEPCARRGDRGRRCQHRRHRGRGRGSALERSRARGSSLGASGPAAARNTGLAEAHGDVVAWTDSDCVPSVGWLAAGLDALAVPGTVLVQGRTAPDPGGPLGRWAYTQDIGALTGLYEACNLFVRADDLRAAGGFPEHIGNFGEDVVAGWRVLRGGRRGVFCDDALVHHEVRHPGFGWFLRWSRLYRNWPLVVREVPEIRDGLLWHRVFLRRADAEVVAGIVGLTAAALLRRPLLAVAAAPWLRRRVNRADLVESAQLLAFDVATVAALAEGSLRHRTLVL